MSVNMIISDVIQSIENEAFSDIFGTIYGTDEAELLLYVVSLQDSMKWE